MKEEVIDGVPHVLVPKDVWEKIRDVVMGIDARGE